MSTDIRLFDLLNLSIGTPEAGLVNFRALHTLLHAILHRLNIQDATTPWTEDLEQKGHGFTIQHNDSRQEITPYHLLEEKLLHMENQLAALERLPNGTELLGCTNSGSSPVSEMWHMMQLRRKVEANQDGVSKSMALIQDLMREISDLRASRSTLQEDVSSLQEQLSQLNVKDLQDKSETLEQCCHQVDDLGKELCQLQEKMKLYPDPAELTQVITWDVLQDTLVNSKQMQQEQAPTAASKYLDEDRVSPHPQELHADGASPSFKVVVERYPETVNTLSCMGQLWDKHSALDERVAQLEKDKTDRSELQYVRESFTDMVNQKMPEDLLQQLNRMKVVVESLPTEREKKSDLVADASGPILRLEAECKRLSDALSRLAEEQREKQSRIDVLYNSLKHLDEQKADKELVEMKIDIKADKIALETKVNQVQFDTMTEQLNSMLQELLSKVTGQEQDWHSVVNKISTEMDNKLNRIELDPLKRQLEQRWKAIRTQLQAQPIPEFDAAAGFRKQLIARFHCISCDRPLDMVIPRPQLITIPSAPGLPSHKSSRPYTVYDLERVRQHSRCERIPEMADYSYLPVPRSCGGTHTLTLSQRRSTRSQNGSQFVQMSDEVQPPPRPAQPEEVDILGLDGQIYKGRLDLRTAKNKEYKLPSISPNEDSPGECVTEPHCQRVSLAKPLSRAPVRPQSARTACRESASAQSARGRPSSSFGRLSQATMSPLPLGNGELKQKLEIHLELLQTSQGEMMEQKCT